MSNPDRELLLTDEDIIDRVYERLKGTRHEASKVQIREMLRISIKYINTSIESENCFGVRLPKLGTLYCTFAGLRKKIKHCNKSLQFQKEAFYKKKYAKLKELSPEKYSIHNVTRMRKKQRLIGHNSFSHVLDIQNNDYEG